MPAPTRFASAEAQLHETAIAATGLDDFGDKDYLTGLGVMLASFDENTNRPEPAREYCWGTLVGALVGRLHAHKGWREQPECLQRAIKGPLIITGIPRTGTTVLHKLLSMDPQFQGLEMWLTSFPMARPPRATWDANPLYQATVAGLEGFYAMAPHFRAIHNMVADEVDECLEVLKQSFVSNRYGSTFRLPAYDAWWLAQDERPAYRYYADVLRLVGANDSDKRWLLKNPGHVWSLDALLEQFPDACVVQTHRDPAKAIPSVCSTLETTRTLEAGVAPDPRELGQRESALWSEAMRRSMAVRDRHPTNRFFDVDHRAFHADPLGTVRRIYAHFGLDLSALAEARMKARIEANPESSHGAHNYTLEHFGLTRESLHGSFRDYIQRYDLV